MGVREEPVGTFETAGILRGVARRRRPTAVLHELVAIALVVEPRQPTAAASRLVVLGQLAELSHLAGRFAFANDKARWIMKLQMVDEGSEENGLPRPAWADDADAFFDR